MTEFSRDWRKLYREAREVNNYHRMSEIVEQVLTEAGVPDPLREAKSAAAGTAAALAKNSEGHGPTCKKL